MAFENVSFHNPDGAEVLKSVSFTLERGKTYKLACDQQPVIHPGQGRPQWVVW